MSDGSTEEPAFPDWDAPPAVPAGEVELTLMNEQPARFRFGIRGLIFATALLGAFFALINLVGTLWAFLIATLVSVLAMCLVLLLAVSFRIGQGPGAPASKWMIRLERLNVWLIVSTVLLTIGLVFAGGAQGIMSVMNRRAMHAEWHDELGFRHSGISIFRQGRIRRYVEITSVQPGGVFEAVGIRENEVIAMEEDDFFRTLEDSRGESVTITLGSGGASGQWEDFTTRQVTFDVP